MIVVALSTLLAVPADAREPVGRVVSTHAGLPPESAGEPVDYMPPARLIAIAKAGDDVSRPWDERTRPKRLNDRLVAGAMRTADTYWRRQGHARCTTTTMTPLSYVEPWLTSWINEAGDGTVARAPTDACLVYIDRAYLASVHYDLRSRYRLDRFERLHDLCLIVVHERGHNEGLGHDAGGIMTSLHEPVFECRQWARTSARQRTD